MQFESEWLFDHTGAGDARNLGAPLERKLRDEKEVARSSIRHENHARQVNLFAMSMKKSDVKE